ncbi:uncharacterized protein LOC120354421 isoform X2 [Nilaparvata lugens]|uniref:uncharacterized protein LOC120354421 isoform X2 n=1 Tax=Nilaparvata lugens TaxID=108931 RepID=UPI00193D36BE|nr:uncharacterized protein LOC120354421 isoform X2 [Nilaparvata lugens]
MRAAFPTAGYFTQWTSHERYPRAAVRLGYPSIRSSIYRHRQLIQPPMPHSLHEFGEIIQRDEWRHMMSDRDGQPFFRGLIGGEGWSAAIYLSQKMLNALRGTERIHVDATFKTVPAQLQAQQLLTIHGEYMHHLFPLAYVLMTRRTQDAYEGVLSYLKNQMPALNPTFVLADFEQAIQNATLTVWPNCRIVGCFFHYTQAVYRRMVQLNTAAVMRQSIEASKAGHMLMSLALLPSARIEAGMEVIKAYIEAHNLEVEFRDILEYMENFWIAIIGVNRMSVADQPHRTNNALEGFYSRLLELMGPHPGVWKFHKKLRDIEMSQWLEYSRMVSGVRHVRPLRRVYARQNSAIFEATEMLRLNQYNLAEFLSRVSHTTRGLTVRLHGGAAQAGQLAAEPMMPPPPPRAGC